MMDKDCRDCVYSSSEGCSDHIIKCEYPLPHALTLGAVFSNYMNGIGCPLLKTKADLISETKEKKSNNFINQGENYES